MTDAAAIASRVDSVWRRIEAAGGSRDTVRLVAVTKTFGVDAVVAARAAGVQDFGENYAQELEAKATALDAQWHFLGSIQRRKVRDIAPLVSLWHGVDRVDEGETIARQAPGAAVLVQVNVTGEASKAGCTWQEAGALIERLRKIDVDLQGLMAVGPLGEPEASRSHFRRLAQLARTEGLRELSMGMSGDLEVAVEEGATIVRVGTSIFGSRSLRR